MIAGLCITLIILLLLIKYFRRRRKCNDELFKDLHEIPCPDELPIIGNTTEIFWDEHELWKKARNRALNLYPIYRLKMLNKNIVYLLHPEDIKMILGVSEGSQKGPFYDPFRKLAGNGLINNNGKSWRSRRKLLSKFFHFSILKNYIEIFNKQVNSAIAQLHTTINQYIDVSVHVENLTLKVINETILGNGSTSTDEESRSYIESMATISEITLIKVTKPYVNWFWRFLKLREEEDAALRKMRKYVSRAIEDNSAKEVHQERGYQSMLGLLLSAPDLFDNVAVRNEIDTFLFAALDTTSISLSFMLLALANYPQHQETIYREIKKTVGEHGIPTYSDLTSMEFLDRFVKESLRLYPPLVVMERILTKEVLTKTGYRLPVGTLILFQILDIHRNPNLFPDPEKFDPDRFLIDNIAKRHPFSYIPFSAGPRNCIAQKYALLNIKTSICRLMQNFKLEPVTIIENIEFLPDAMLHIKDGIKVKLIKRLLI